MRRSRSPRRSTRWPARSRRSRSEAEGAALWRVEAYPRAPVLDAALEVRLALAAAACRRPARSDRRGAIARARLAGGKPPRLSAAADRAVSGPRLALAGARRTQRAGGRDRHRDRRGDRVRHRRAPLDRAAACWRSTAWRGGAVPRGRSISAPAAASWRSPRQSCCIAAVLAERYRLRLRSGRCPSRQAQRRSPGGCAWSARRATAAAPCAARDYDLIFANILARPLALMARDLARAIAPGGIAVLAGLLRAAGGVGAGGAPGSGPRPRAPPRHRRMVDPDIAVGPDAVGRGISGDRRRARPPAECDGGAGERRRPRPAAACSKLIDQIAGICERWMPISASERSSSAISSS